MGIEHGEMVFDVVFSFLAPRRVEELHASGNITAFGIESLGIN